MVQGSAGAHVLPILLCKNLAGACIICCACSVKGRISSRLWLRPWLLLTLLPLKVHGEGLHAVCGLSAMHNSRLRLKCSTQQPG